jgi:hypothetical protein
MAAPTTTADVNKSLANSEPSTHGPTRHFAATQDVGRFGTETDINRQARPAASVANDPKRTWAERSRCLLLSQFQCANLSRYGACPEPRG